jgi:hypothetical protein
MMLHVRCTHLEGQEDDANQPKKCKLKHKLVQGFLRGRSTTAEGAGGVWVCRYQSHLGLTSEVASFISCRVCLPQGPTSPVSPGSV